MYYSIASVGSTVVMEKKYTINRGDTVSTIAENFDFPVASWRYTLWLKWFAPVIPNLQIGEYRVDRPITLEVFFTETLSHPSHTDQSIMILPGWNIYDIDEYLAQKKVLKTGEFVAQAANDFSLYVEDFPFLK